MTYSYPLAVILFCTLFFCACEDDDVLTPARQDLTTVVTGSYSGDNTYLQNGNSNQEYDQSVIITRTTDSTVNLLISTFTSGEVNATAVMLTDTSFRVEDAVMRNNNSYSGTGSLTNDQLRLRFAANANERYNYEGTRD